MIKVFVGTCPETWLPFKVLEFSILYRTECNCEVMPLDKWQELIPEKLQKMGATMFSFQRFLIPELCEHQGRGIYLDSDMILRTDINELWTQEFPEGKKILTTPGWQTAVLLYDCTVPWDIQEMRRRLKTRETAYSKLLNMRGFKELDRCLDPMWDCMDRPKREKIDRPDAKLMHYTYMPTQPWLYPRHPKGHIWEAELLKAIECHHITKGDVMREIELRHVRPSLASLVGEDPPYPDSEFIAPSNRGKK